MLLEVADLGAPRDTREFGERDLLAGQEKVRGSRGQRSDLRSPCWVLDVLVGDEDVRAHVGDDGVGRASAPERTAKGVLGAPEEAFEPVCGGGDARVIETDEEVARVPVRPADQVVDEVGGRGGEPGPRRACKSVEVLVEAGLRFGSAPGPVLPLRRVGQLVGDLS